MAGTRRYDLDWLRVIAFMLLILFHSGMPFVEFPWHIKNAQTSDTLTVVWGYLHGWRMPLLFLISGAGIWYAMGKRSAAGFLAERSRRLLIPLCFGVLVVVPPQIYLERLTQGVEYSSYIEFYPHFFDGFYFSAEGGNFSPHHLWFIGSLFVYCVFLTPVLVWLRSARGDGFRAWFDQFVGRGANVYSLIIPFYVGYALWPGGFFFNSGSALLIVLGFLLVSSQAVWPVLERLRLQSLAASLVLFALALSIYFTSSNDARLLWYDLISIPAALTMLFAVLGLAKRHLSFNNRVLAYCNEGVYPFYILHQTFTVIIAYWLTPLEFNLWIKFAVTIVGTIVTTGLTYHVLIRPFNVIRPLFGMKRQASSRLSMSLAACLVPLLMLPNNGLRGQELCATVPCGGSSCSVSRFVTIATANGNAVDSILWFTSAHGGSAFNAICHPVPPIEGSMGIATFSANATGAQPRCLWVARIKTAPTASYFPGPTCELTGAEDGLPVELLTFEFGYSY